MEINYKKLIPYPFDVVLSQYYDYEHIEHVHPTTLGAYRLLENDGDRTVYEQIWPRNFLGRRATSTVEQTFHPPNEIRFHFTAGRHKGTRVITRLLDDPSGGTLVDETYHIPLPGWPWLTALVRPFVIRQVDRIWDEDTDVEVCRDGWPGLPASAKRPDPLAPIKTPATTPSAISLPDIPPGEARVITHDGTEIAVFNHSGQLHAVENRCPHTGGPLALGTVEGHEVVCPWHGARFSLLDGSVTHGPAPCGVRTFPICQSPRGLVIDPTPTSAK